MKKFIYIFVSIIFVLTVIVGCYFLFNLKFDNPDDNDDETNKNQTIEIVAESNITLSLDDGKVKLSYYIVNKDNLEYTKQIILSNDNILLDSSEYIIPQKVGTTTITIKLVTGTTEYKKYINVVVCDAEIDVALTFSNGINEVDKLFVGETYYMNVLCTKNLFYDYDVFISENIENFEKVFDSDKNLKFKFKIKCLGNDNKVSVSFVYRGKNFNTCIDCYNKVNDIDIKFSRDIIDETINLYLFDNSKIALANDDGFYNDLSYIINNKENVINEYKVEIVGTSVKVDNNKIIAISEGESCFRILSLDGFGYYEQYKVIVEKVKLNSLVLKYDKNKIFKDDKVELSKEFLPVYAIYDFEYEGNDNFSIDNDIVTFNNCGTFDIIVKDNVSSLTNSVTVHVEEKLEYSFIVSFLQKFLMDNNASFTNDVLTIDNKNETNTIYFSYAIDTKIVISNNAVSIVLSSNDISGSYESADFNAIILNLQGKGEIIVTITLIENTKISYSFKIVII